MKVDVVAFLGWLVALLSPSRSLQEGSSGSGDCNSSSNSTAAFEIFPRLYGVIAASGLIFMVVITLVCCTMVLVHGLNRVLPSKKEPYTLRKLRDVSDYGYTEMPTSVSRSTAEEDQGSAEEGHDSVYLEKGDLLARQTTV